MIRRPPRSTQSRSSAASDVYKRQGDMCHPSDGSYRASPRRRVHIDGRRLEEFLSNRTTELGHIRPDVQMVLVERDVSHERKAIAVQPRRWETDKDVACMHGASVDDMAAVDESHAEPGEVILVDRIETRHLGRLAPHKRTVCLATACRRSP